MKRVYRHPRRGERGHNLWFRLEIPLSPFGYHRLAISHMGHSDGFMHLEISYNGRLYGRVYRNWRMRMFDSELADRARGFEYDHAKRMYYKATSVCHGVGFSHRAYLMGVHP